MTRNEIVSALRDGLLAAGFVAVDDLSTDEEIYLQAHTGPEETDDTPLSHVNFTPKEIAESDDDQVASMIAARVEMVKRSAEERKGQIRRFAAEKLAEETRLAEVQHVIDLREAAEADRLAKIEAARAVLTALNGW